MKARNTQRLGTRVLLTGETIDDAAVSAHLMAADENLVFVHPYHDDHVMAGQGTLALEMLADVPDLDVIIVPVGGGGLIGGIAIAARAIRPRMETVGVEAEMFPSMDQRLMGLETKAGGRTLADGIAVKTPGENAMAIVRDLVSDIVLGSEAQLEDAVQTYLEIEKTVAEGGDHAACLPFRPASALSWTQGWSCPDRRRH